MTYLVKFPHLSHLVLDGSMSNVVDSLGRLLQAHSADTDGALRFICSKSDQNEHFFENLRSLALRKWQFGKPGLEAIASLPRLTELDLSFWKLEISPTLALKSLLKLSPNLTCLKLASCKLNAKLVELVGKFENLEYLDLRENHRNITSELQIRTALQIGRGIQNFTNYNSTRALSSDAFGTLTVVTESDD